MRRALPINLTPIPNEHPWQLSRAADGYMCWDSSPDAAAAIDVLESLLNHRLSPDTLPVLSNIGTHSTVYKLCEWAIKVFGKRRTSRRDNVSGFAYLQASVALDEGLKILAQPIPQKQRETTFVYSAPRVYGSFIVGSVRGSRPPITIMSLEPGTESQSWALPQPSYRARQRVCRAAIEAVGLPPGIMRIDRNPENVLVLPIDEATTQITQLDVMSTLDGLYRINPLPAPPHLI